MTPGGKAPRAAGDRFERAMIQRLKAADYLVIRSAGSHGPADIVALRGDRLPSLIQCKITDNTTTRERQAFYRVAARAAAVPLIAFRPGARGFVVVRIRPNGDRAKWDI